MSPYPDAPLSGSLPSISSDYSLSSLPGQYSQEYHDYLASSAPNFTDAYSASAHHQRSGSATEYESLRHCKRHRATTSNASLCSQDEAASLLGQMSRSYSDQTENQRPPSLADSYSAASSNPRYTEQSQATAGMTQMQLGSRGTYDYNSYINANAPSGCQRNGQREHRADGSATQQSG